MTDRKRALLDSAVRIIARQGARGLRVEEVARDAKVSTALIYHHFGDRSTLLRRALLHIEQTAKGYTVGTQAMNQREVLVAAVVGEFQDNSGVRDNSAAWGELRDAAVFDLTLRPTLATQTEQWIDRLAEIITAGQTDGSISEAVDAYSTSQRLTALIEGLSSRWLADLISTDEARSLATTAVEREIGGLETASRVA